MSINGSRSEPTNEFGYFDDKAREYVIVNPQTPYPWINYLGSEHFFSLISNTGGGYSFYKDAKFRRLTRYRYNNVPVDDGGRYFYIKDGETLWSPGWKPVKTPLDSYQCRHGLGYTEIIGEKLGVSASVMHFVPLQHNVEIQRVRLKNTSGQHKSLTLFSFVEWCLWNAEDDMSNFQRNYSTGEVEVDGAVIYHKTEYRERRNHYAFYSVNDTIAGFDTDRDSFLGAYNGFDRPKAVCCGQSFDSIAQGWSPIASHSLHVELAAGETKEWVFLLGYIENPEQEKWHQPGVINKTRAQKVIADFDSSEKVDAAFLRLNRYWDELLSHFQLNSQDERLDRMVNVWNQYQCMVTFNLSRSASFFESGIGRGMGFRDSNQDLIGFVHLVPERARQRILDIAATQFEDGSAYHQYQPLTKRGNAAIGGNFNDDPLWLITSVSAYLKETGDFPFLDEQVPFENDEHKARSLFEHLTASFDHVINHLGPHGLPLIGRADWNDCLNLNCFSADPNESFQTTENKQGDVAESVMIAGMFVFYGREYVALCRRMNKAVEAERASVYISAMISAVERYGWDGNWFLRAYDAAGAKVGSHENNEGKIFIESQGFCTMAAIGHKDGKMQRALDSVKSLLDTEYGIVLNYPAFQRYYTEYGEISTYPPGYKENGGIFCHNNPWIIIGETVLGRGDNAFNYYRKLAPAFTQDVARRKTEPYVYSQMVAGKEAVVPGEAKNSWLTGTAAWNYHAITEHILGIKPDYNGLRIDPCIPCEWTDYEIVRRFRGAVYCIAISNPDKVSKGVKSVTVDGMKIEGTLIVAREAGATYNVKVVMGD